MFDRPLARACLVSILLLFAAACSRSPGVPSPVSDPASRRLLPAGSVIGQTSGEGAHVWHGIAFAKPPTGALRWRAPEALPAWRGEFEALTPPVMCTQYPMTLAQGQDPDRPVGREDCLQLSVYAPRFDPDAVPAQSESLPVMFWIHGGGNLMGTSSSYDWSRFAETHRVIVVATTYRLGPFGWFRHPALWEAQDDALDRSGNFGTLDLIRSLEWVRENVSAFGGDPGNVTIFGESAGGNNVLALLLSPPARGLFHRAIAQSGGTWSASISESENWVADEEPGRPFSSREFLARLLVGDGSVPDREAARAYADSAPPRSLAGYLRGKSRQEIIGVLADRAEVNMSSVPLTIREGTVVPKGEMIDHFRAGAYHRVPTMVGTNRDETKLFMMRNPEYTWMLFGVLPRLRDVERYERDAEHASDAWKVDGADQIAIAIESQGDLPVYAYRFDWDEQPSLMGTDMGVLLGAGHAVEIPFVMGSPALEPLMRVMFREDSALASDPLSIAMGRYWAQFARTGDPGQGGDEALPRWAPWNSATEESPRFIVLDSGAGGGIRMSSDYRTPQRIADRVFTDTRFADDAERCEALVELVETFPDYDEADRISRGCDSRDTPRMSE